MKRNTVILGQREIHGVASCYDRDAWIGCIAGYVEVNNIPQISSIHIVVKDNDQQIKFNRLIPKGDNGIYEEDGVYVGVFYDCTCSDEKLCIAVHDSIEETNNLLEAMKKKMLEYTDDSICNVTMTRNM